jgi:hypothetical protein
VTVGPGANLDYGGRRDVLKLLDALDHLAITRKNVLRKLQAALSQEPEDVRKIGPMGMDYFEHGRFHVTRAKVPFHRGLAWHR